MEIRNGMGIGGKLFSVVVLLWPLSLSAGLFEEASQLLQDGDPEEAMERVRLLLAQQPDHLEGRILRGVTLVQLGRMDEAVQAFEKLTAEHPRLPQPYNNLAAIYAAMGRSEEARRALMRALAADPDYDIARENLGDLYVSMALEQYAAMKEHGVRVRSKAVLLQTFRNRYLADGARQVVPDTPASARKRKPSREHVLARKTDTVNRPEEGKEPASVAEKMVAEAGKARATAPPREKPQPAATRVENKNVAREEEEPLEPAEKKSAATEQAAVAEVVERSMAAAPSACLQVGPLNVAGTRKRVSAWLQGQGASVEIVRRPTPVNIYWFYMPPLESRQAAREKARSLRDAGIGDVAVITSGEKANGLTLGAYSWRSTMENRRKQLDAAGVEYKIKTRETEKALPWAVVVDAPAGLEDELGKAWPDLRVEKGACPAP
jgi:tetratricopeptide (TPR) repeat protein